MILAAFVGMATKFAEIALGVKYRKVHEDGTVSGGAMYYLSEGLHQKWLGMLFSILVIPFAFVISGIVDTNTIALTLNERYSVPNPIKVRKLLITAGVYESEVAEKVQDTFEEYWETQSYKKAILSTAKALNLSKASVTSYLPYKKGVYFPSTEKEKISVGAERQRRYRAMKLWRADQTEENFWGVVTGQSAACQW